MKNFITILILLFIAVCSASAQTVIKYKHVYDVDENGVRFDDRVSYDEQEMYIFFNSSKSQFYQAKDEAGNALGSEIYRFIKTENGIHYYGRNFDHSEPPKNIGLFVTRGIVYEHLKECLKFMKGTEYVCFSTDFSKINWQEIYRPNKYRYDKDREWKVYEIYVEPKQKAAPSVLY